MFYFHSLHPPWVVEQKKQPAWRENVNKHDTVVKSPSPISPVLQSEREKELSSAAPIKDTIMLPK